MLGKSKTFIKIVVFFFVALIFSLILISFIFNDKIVRILTNELNKNLNTKIEVETINFSLLKKFPNATVNFGKVTVFSVNRDSHLKNDALYNDTMLYAENIFLSFGMVDLLHNQFSIKGLHISNGSILLLDGSKGLCNYIFWKEDTLKKENNEFNINLQNVLLKNVGITYINRESRFNLKGKLYHFSLSGSLSEKGTMLKIKTNFRGENIQIKDVNYITNKTIELSGKLDKIDNEYIIDKGVFKMDKEKYFLSGIINLNEKSKSYNINIAGDNLKFSSLKAWIPIMNKGSNYKANGQIDFNAELVGHMANKGKIDISTDFILQKGKLEFNNGIVLNDVSFNGRFSNYKNGTYKEKLVINNFRGKTISGKMEGNLIIEDFKKPLMNSRVKAKLLLKELNHFVRTKNMVFREGTIEMDISGKGYIPENAEEIDFFEHINFIGNINVEEGEVMHNNIPNVIEKINADIQISDILEIKSLSAWCNHSDITLNAKIVPFENIFSKNETEVVSTLYAQNIYLNDIIDKSENKVIKDQNKGIFPNWIKCQVDYFIENFYYKDSYAKNVLGTLRYKPKLLSFKILRMESCNGTIAGNGAIVQELNGDYSCRLISEIQNVNVSYLFKSFNNFNQDKLTSEHLEGNLNAHANLGITFSNQWEIYKPSVLLNMRINLKDGKLNNFTPALKLSKFVELEELKNIHFSELKNEILIKNEKLIIPEMDIYSSALSIYGSGIHKFNSKYTYHVSIKLSELLANKAINKKKANESFGIIEEDNKRGITLFFEIHGDKEKLNIDYDKKKAREALRNNIKTEKTEIRKILNEEYGWFKNQEIKKDKKQEQGKMKFRFMKDETNEPDVLRDKTIQGSEGSMKFEWEDYDSSDTSNVQDDK